MSREVRLYCRCGAVLEERSSDRSVTQTRPAWLREHRPHGLGTAKQAERARAERARMEREKST